MNHKSMNFSNFRRLKAKSGEFRCGCLFEDAGLESPWS